MKWNKNLNVFNYKWGKWIYFCSQNKTETNHFWGFLLPSHRKSTITKFKTSQTNLLLLFKNTTFFQLFLLNNVFKDVFHTFGMLMEEKSLAIRMMWEILMFNVNWKSFSGVVNHICPGKIKKLTFIHVHWLCWQIVILCMKHFIEKKTAKNNLLL